MLATVCEASALQPDNLGMQVTVVDEDEGLTVTGLLYGYTVGVRRRNPTVPPNGQTRSFVRLTIRGLDAPVVVHGSAPLILNRRPL